MVSGRESNQLSVAGNKQISATLDEIVGAAKAINSDDLLGLLSFDASHEDCTILSLGYAIALACHYAVDELNNARAVLQNQSYPAGNEDTASAKETGLARLLPWLTPSRKSATASPQLYKASSQLQPNQQVRQAYVHLKRASIEFSALENFDAHLPSGLSSRGELAKKISKQLELIANQLVPNPDSALFEEANDPSFFKPINPDWLYKLHEDAITRSFTRRKYGQAILDYILAHAPSGRTAEAKIVPV